MNAVMDTDADNPFEHLYTIAGKSAQHTMYVVIEMLTYAGVICNTSESTLSAGRNIVAPIGATSKEADTKNIIHVFMPLLNTENGGSDIVRCTLGCTPSLSTSISTSSLLSFSLLRPT